MAASYDTVRNLIEVVQRHVDADTFLKIITDLREVDGNVSFKTTIERIYQSLSVAKSSH